MQASLLWVKDTQNYIKPKQLAHWTGLHSLDCSRTLRAIQQNPNQTRLTNKQIILRTASQGTTPWYRLATERSLSHRLSTSYVAWTSTSNNKPIIWFKDKHDVNASDSIERLYNQAVTKSRSDILEILSDGDRTGSQYKTPIMQTFIRRSDRTEAGGFLNARLDLPFPWPCRTLRWQSEVFKFTAKQHRTSKHTWSPTHTHGKRSSTR